MPPGWLCHHRYSTLYLPAVACEVRLLDILKFELHLDMSQVQVAVFAGDSYNALTPHQPFRLISASGAAEQIVRASGW